MPLSNKKMGIQELSSKLPSFLKENALDVIIGTMQLTEGVFVLLFSHRFNKEVSLTISGTHDLSKVTNEIQLSLEKV